MKKERYQTNDSGVPLRGGPGNRGARGYSKPKNLRKTISQTLAYLKCYKNQSIWVVILTIISALANTAGTYFIRPLINNYIVPLIGQKSPDFSGFIHMLLEMAFFYVTAAVTDYIMHYLVVNISTGTMCRIRKELFDHMEELPISYFDQHTHGEVMSFYTNDTDAMREMFSIGIPQILYSVIEVVSISVMMLILSWKMTLLNAAMLAGIIYLMKAITKSSAHYFNQQQKELSVVNGYVEEMSEGQKVIKVFNHEDVVKEDFRKINQDLFEASSKANIFANVLMPVLGNISYLNYALLAIFSGYLAIQGRMDLGTIGSFMQYSRIVSMPISRMSQQLNSVLTALAGAERIYALLAQPAEVDAGNITLVNARAESDGTIREAKERTDIWAWKVPGENGTASYRLLKGDVRFEDVSFSYVPGKIVLDHVSPYAKPGQKIAFVGSTGAGKTTITNLINRFYDVNEGRITFDGFDIKDIRKDDLRRSLGMVLQDTHIFTGTVMENIRYGRLDATDEEVIEAARLANADFFISHLPQGYQTVLTADGANLSQGQRQLLSIARAAVSDPPVLILDEATSSIDTRTEALIEKGMDTLMENRTVFVIAHRLSTIRNAHAIMVLEQGRIIERGDHESLLALKGRYYQLYTGMFELS